jgi:hypothetical protein
MGAIVGVVAIWRIVRTFQKHLALWMSLVHPLEAGGIVFVSN